MVQSIFTITIKKMNLKIKRFAKSVILTLLSFVFAYNALAAPTSGTTTSTATLNNPLGDPKMTVGVLIGRIVTGLMGVVGVIAVLMIIYGGIMYMTSAGNDEKIGSAKKIITGAIIGLVVSILAYVIVDFVVKAITGSS